MINYVNIETNMETVFMKLGEAILGLGQLTILIGIPALSVKYLIIQPIFTIRREMKNSKTFRQAWGEAFKDDGSYIANSMRQYHMPASSCYRLDDMNTSSRYVGLPNNTFTIR